MELHSHKKMCGEKKRISDNRFLRSFRFCRCILKINNNKTILLTKMSTSWRISRIYEACEWNDEKNINFLPNNSNRPSPKKACRFSDAWKSILSMIVFRILHFFSIFFSVVDSHHNRERTIKSIFIDNRLHWNWYEIFSRNRNDQLWNDDMISVLVHNTRIVFGSQSHASNNDSFRNSFPLFSGSRTFF